MKYVVIGGAGRQGLAILHFLSENTQLPIISVDLTKEYPEWVVAAKNIQCKFAYQIEKDDIVISCLRPRESLNFLRQSTHRLAAGFIGLGGSDQVTKEMCIFSESFRHQTIIIPDCGLAPGLISSIAGNAAREGKKFVEIYCGGLAADPRNIYVRSFSTEGLLAEYFGKAKTLFAGEIVEVPTLLEIRSLNYYSRPGLANLEATHTSGGLSLTPETLEGKLDKLEYLTLRPRGHWEFLKREVLWRPDAKETLEILFEEVSSKRPDKVILTTRIDNEWDVLEWSYDTNLNLSAMSQATGYTAGAVATMVEDGLLPHGKVIGMEEVDLQEILGKIGKEQMEEPAND